MGDYSGSPAASRAFERSRKSSCRPPSPSEREELEYRLASGYAAAGSASPLLSRNEKLVSEVEDLLGVPADGRMHRANIARACGTRRGRRTLSPAREAACRRWLGTRFWDPIPSRSRVGLLSRRPAQCGRSCGSLPRVDRMVAAKAVTLNRAQHRTAATRTALSELRVGTFGADHGCRASWGTRGTLSQGCGSAGNVGGVVAVAGLLTDLAVLAVDDQLAVLLLCYLPSFLDRFVLGCRSFG